MLELEKLPESEKKTEMIDTIKRYMCKLIEKFIFYSPLGDPLIQSFELLSLDTMDKDRFKEQVDTLNKHFKIFSHEDAANLNFEINDLFLKNINSLKRQAQDSSLRL